MEPGMNSKPPAYIIWISSLRFWVRSWVKIVKEGHEVSVIQKSFRTTTEVPSRNIEFEPVRKHWSEQSCQPQLLVVLVSEIFQNDLNFSLEKYQSW